MPPIKAGPFGSSLTKDTYVPAGYKVYGQEQVIRGDYLYGDYFIPLKKYRELESCAVRPGDVLLSLVGTVGRLLAIPNDAPPGVINPRLIRFSFDKSRVCSKYFKFLFESGQVQSLLERQAQGGTMGVLNAGALRPFRIQLPPLPEQCAIAEALSDVDALLGALDRLIAKKRDLKQAAIQQLLTGQTRLPGFHGEWEVKPLGDVVQIQKGQLITSSTLLPGDIPVIAGGKQPAYFHAAANRFGRTITISASGASAGFVALYNGPIFASDCSTIGEAAGYSLDFVFYQLLVKQHAIYKAQTGGAQPHIHAKDLNPIPFHIPPLAEQSAIAEVLSAMDADLAALDQRRTKTRALKQAMMQELLTGKTRLV